MEPWTPGCSDVMKGDESCQHCMTETPFATAEVVTLRYLAAEAPVDGSRSASIMLISVMREEKEHMTQEHLCLW